MPAEAAIARLTENEKLCLRRRLRHQTAKQMAIDLGISPHAVEKRLKMARTKLGLSSSLEAARMLAAHEAGYGQPVPQAPDLAGAAALGQPTAGRRIGSAALPGALVMSLIVAALTLFALQSTTEPATPAARPGLPPSRPIESVAFRKATPEELRAFIADSFATMDKDLSSYIERAEAPEGFGLGKPHPVGERPAGKEQVTWIRGTMSQAMWIARADSDGDGKVSAAEYLAASLPMFEPRGVPANWKPRS